MTLRHVLSLLIMIAAMLLVAAALYYRPSELVDTD